MPYHHGALHEALLRSAETIMNRDGLTALTLRAAAREAGVSHAAPTHHFGDMTGLLSELAAAGFRRFGTELAAAVASKTSPADRMQAMGEAYVAFARKNPSMFLLMFRGERLDPKRPALNEAMQQAFGVLMRGATQRRGTRGGDRSVDVLADIVRAWSMVHGLAMLLIDHRLEPILSRLPARSGTNDFLRAVIRGG